jgi:ABC-2 type transport system ATP-binding protein
MELLTAKNLHFSYGVKKVLDDISLRVESGELILLTGINGSGKTTLLKLLARVRSLQYGEVKSLATSLHLPKGSFYPEISLKENLYFFSKLYGSDEKILNDLVDRFSLENFWDQNIDELSLGQKLRGDLVRALLKPAQIYLLDEPFNGLDYESQNLLIEYLATMIKKDLSIIIATHNQEALKQLKFKEYQISNGKIRLQL